MLAGIGSVLLIPFQLKIDITFFASSTVIDFKAFECTSITLSISLSPVSRLKHTTAFILTGKGSESSGKGANGSIGEAITGFELTFEAIELESDISKMKRDLEKRTDEINKNLSHRLL